MAPVQHGNGRSVLADAQLLPAHVLVVRYKPDGQKEDLILLDTSKPSQLASVIHWTDVLRCWVEGGPSSEDEATPHALWRMRQRLGYSVQHWPSGTEEAARCLLRSLRFLYQLMAQDANSYVWFDGYLEAFFSAWQWLHGRAKAFESSILEREADCHAHEYAMLQGQPDLSSTRHLEIVVKELQHLASQSSLAKRDEHIERACRKGRRYLDDLVETLRAHLAQVRVVRVELGYTDSALAIAPEKLPRNREQQDSDSTSSSSREETKQSSSPEDLPSRICRHRDALLRGPEQPRSTRRASAYVWQIMACPGIGPYLSLIYFFPVQGPSSEAVTREIGDAWHRITGDLGRLREVPWLDRSSVAPLFSEDLDLRGQASRRRLANLIAYLSRMELYSSAWPYWNRASPHDGLYDVMSVVTVPEIAQQKRERYRGGTQVRKLRERLDSSEGTS